MALSTEHQREAGRASAQKRWGGRGPSVTIRVSPDVRDLLAERAAQRRVDRVILATELLRRGLR